MTKDIDQLSINTIKTLAVDSVSAANSGHPGAPLALATLAHAIFQKTKFTPNHPKWPNRDRFVLSNGHACALLYSILFLYGFDYTLDDLKNFRQLNSKTPGHPETPHCPGVEVTTGPLGQGIANAVGIALAQKQFAATYNKPDYPIADARTFCIVGDGCLMEGISSEASSLAGHLQLGNLTVFWDSNKISIDGSTDLAFTEDVPERYRAYGWHVIDVDEENPSLSTLSKAIDEASKVTDKPTFVKIKTTIGIGSEQAGTAAVHGAPLKPDDVKHLKKAIGFDPEQSFVVPSEVTDYFKKSVESKDKQYVEWQKLFKDYSHHYPELAEEINRREDGRLPPDWERFLPSYKPSDKAAATRKLSETVLGALTPVIPELIGGAADLTPSTLTRTQNAVDFQPPSTGLGDYSGRYIRFGVREHAMGAMMNGIAAFGSNFKVFGGTFLNFVSYAAGAVRLSAISQLPIIWVGTHDSVGLGEDGPTHQPIETLAHLRAIPNLSVWRPADGNEVSAAYKAAISSVSTPHVLALTRQGVPHLEGSSIEKASKGGYVLVEAQDPDIILVSSGSEVSIAVEAAKLLGKNGTRARVVSMPSFFAFDQQSEKYRFSVLPDGVPILSIEVMSPFGWSNYSHVQFGVSRFGFSAKYTDIYDYLEFTPEGISSRANKTIDFYKGSKLLSPLSKPFYPQSFDLFTHGR
ncbi:Transketolase [Yamadazyma tenuis]|uniref:transketolase n=1 Tax=Candida tenuis (strain ATCC 10573 / BCRC 21748 / CBS 615 / JCM 9827 / NBRC 10315 / NRRL Y-1498 / VKM Y-70) TaxID=590646 RepID=G3BBY9_CANTC|nr:uncharacterized protein CANTEDRAFT_131980 [Yamadazyma tenuis ATCC 10573]EGV60119.1 hypothetical protein CANTEDRAFT_131980 [Yamadazyma tenuis ATCC 10573]WEJ94651.1 Transketolase [Yamadazyma tenuis]